MSGAVVPVKSLAASKSRLLPELSRDDLSALALAMAEDVVAALIATPEVGRVAVATPDPQVAEAARRLGAEALEGPDPGLNEVIEASATGLGLAPDDALLVVLGDVAGATPEDLSRLFMELDALPDGPAAAWAPSRDGGTSALLRRPAHAFPARFGPESAAAHREAAETAGVPFAEVELASLAIDLDRAEDVELFLATASGGPRTRQWLRRLEWPRKPRPA